MIESSWEGSKGSWDNVYDKEAIQVKVKGMGKIVFVIDGGAICRVTDVGSEEK